ncbi:MAG: hypothetical protein WDO24_00535 [Pseudomonadota bacterium]
MSARNACCRAPTAPRSAIVGEVIDAAKVDIHYLDVGGGFPSTYLGTVAPPLDEFISEIEDGVRALRLRRDCVLMCEPGRALVATGMSLVTQVQLRKGDSLYINDGVYGSLSETVTARPALPGAAHPADRGRHRRAGRLHDLRPDLRQHRHAAAAGTPCPPTCARATGSSSAISAPTATRCRDRFNGFYPDTYVQVDDEAMDVA